MLMHKRFFSPSKNGWPKGKRKKDKLSLDGRRKEGKEKRDAKEEIGIYTEGRAQS